jgi:hypothetical protein
MKGDVTVYIVKITEKIKNHRQFQTNTLENINKCIILKEYKNDITRE